MENEFHADEIRLPPACIFLAFYCFGNEVNTGCFRQERFYE